MQKGFLKVKGQYSTSQNDTYFLVIGSHQRRWEKETETFHTHLRASSFVWKVTIFLINIARKSQQVLFQC